MVITGTLIIPNYSKVNKGTKVKAATSIPSAPSVSMPTEPNWVNKITIDDSVKNTYDLQSFINEKVTDGTPTEIILTRDIIRGGDYPGNNNHVLVIKDGSFIKLTSETGHN
jgi:hypothetical protein